jgi:DNA-binding protein
MSNKEIEVQSDRLDWKDMKEKWLTKIEIMMQKENSPRNRN